MLDGAADSAVGSAGGAGAALGPDVPKSTLGASRCAASSISKNSREMNPNGPARTAPGKVWIALLYVRTVSL